MTPRALLAGALVVVLAACTTSSRRGGSGGGGDIDEGGEGEEGEGEGEGGEDKGEGEGEEGEGEEGEGEEGEGEEGEGEEGEGEEGEGGRCGGEDDNCQATSDCCSPLRCRSGQCALVDVEGGEEGEGEGREGEGEEGEGEEGEGACLEIEPEAVDFGRIREGTIAHGVVELRNCGDIEVCLTQLEVDDASSPDFAVRTAPLEFEDADGDVCLEVSPGEGCDGRQCLRRGEAVRLDVSYTPADVGEDTATIGIESTAGPGTIRLTGTAFDDDGGDNSPPTCVARARLTEDAELAEFADRDAPLNAIPLETLQLDSTESSDSDGRVVARQWAVIERPADSTAELAPNGAQESPSFFLDLAGRYVFSLTVVDDQEATSTCAVHVLVVPDEDIHVQLVWDTPGDRNQRDTGFGAGADLDLHFQHEEGIWFCAPLDLYYANPNPDWGERFDPADDPSLDIDDTDGAGPENVNLDNPEEGTTYGVAVHYFNDHGYGPSVATVRIYIGGELVLEQERELVHDAFWSVASIHWPDEQPELIDGLEASPPPNACP